MAPLAMFSMGDFIEIIGLHAEAGERGFVGETVAIGMGPNTPVRIYVDKFRHCDIVDRGGFRGMQSDMYRSMDVPAPVSVPVRCLKLVRKHAEKMTTRVCDFVDIQSDRLGSIASSKYKDITDHIVSLDSPHGRLPRPAGKDLPGPHTGESFFQDKPTEKIFRQAYGGGFITEWTHSFVSPESSVLDLDRLEGPVRPFYCFKILVIPADKPNAAPKWVETGTARKSSIPLSGIKIFA